jgi:hypothetical protein
MSYIYDGRPKSPTPQFHLSRHVFPLDCMSSLHPIKIVPSQLFPTREIKSKVVHESDIRCVIAAISARY